jgi:hypothetical protein
MTITSRLIADGNTDRALLPILNWTLAQHVQPGSFMNVEWAELRRLKNRPKTLRERFTRAVELYKCDLLFIHRDAENETHDNRTAEIRHEAAASGTTIPFVCVVPVRMQEAWLLFSEQAIRDAAGNPNGKLLLNLPDFTRIESLTDPKEILHQALTNATGLNARRKKQFDPDEAQQNIPLQISDFSPLRQLSAYRSFESDLLRVLKQHFRDHLKPESSAG